MKMRKYVVEFIGTFFFVLTVCMTVGGGLGDFEPIAIGAMYMALVYAGWHISGGHYNPAVSLAFYLRGKLALGELPAYITAQTIGGVLAAYLSVYFLQRMGVPDFAPLELRLGPALLAEFLGTFILVYIIFNVTTARRTVGNSYFGIAIGFTMSAIAYAFKGISGGFFNPALAAGSSAAGMAGWDTLWIYLAAAFAGGAVAAFVFNYVNGPE